MTQPTLFKPCDAHLYGLYDGSWKGVLTDASFVHPAKFSFNLIAWIYQHAIDNKWVERGSLVIDPFGGCACGAFNALKHGLVWCGCELEPKFVALGKQNLKLWQDRYGALPNWGLATITQGDSRYLRKVFHAQVKLSVSSPPYAEIAAGAGGLNHKPAKKPGQQAGRAKGASQSANQHYGQTAGQLSTMGEGQAPGLSVSSPPFEGSLLTKDEKFAHAVARDRRNGSRLLNAPDGYGKTEGNIGNDSGDTFWSAARLVVQEVYALLKPGAHAIWVCGNFVRKKQVVPFCDQWQALCEQAGFYSGVQTRGAQNHKDGQPAANRRWRARDEAHKGQLFPQTSCRQAPRVGH